MATKFSSHADLHRRAGEHRGVLRLRDATRGLPPACGVTDKGMPALAGLKNLQHLELEDTPVNNASLATISQRAALEYLGLAQTRLDDDAIADLVKLKQLKQLKRLDVRLTGIMPDGIKALRSSLPDCTIEK